MAVEWLAIDCGKLPVTVRLARFRGTSGVVECHVTVRLSGDSPADPLDCLAQGYQRALDAAGMDAASAVFLRLFCSDATNQAKAAAGYFGTAPCAVSVIGQPPLPAAKFALWAYHLGDPACPVDKRSDGPTVSCRRGELTHHWTSGLVDCHGDGSREQTMRVLGDYDAWLDAHGLRLADHVVRTWWFMQNIDADYTGLVEARREFFAGHGLTADTHYLASTGIAGCHPEPTAKVALDAYAIGGLRAEQIAYLCAPDFLCPTHDYGVTFERATAISYADRRHVFLSGTASIDPAGSIVHPGDVLAQLDRTLENITALLAQAGANPGDLAAILVYLRDPADGAMVDAALRDRLGTVPYVLVDAPVCRPGWLIEIEGIAVVPASLPELPVF